MKHLIIAGALALGISACAGGTPANTVNVLETGLVAAQAAVLVYEASGHADPAMVAKLQEAEQAATAAVNAAIQAVQAGQAPDATVLAAAQAALTALQAALAGAH